jgi:hypothetical protein
MADLERGWARRVRAYLVQHGGSVPRRVLGGAIRIPDHLRGSVTFAEALAQCGFNSDGSHVYARSGHSPRVRSPSAHARALNN